MDEMVNVADMNWAGLFSEMTSSDKTFLGFLSIVGLSYLAKLVFDSVHDAMEYNYGATITATNIGNLRFSPKRAVEDDYVDENIENDCVFEDKPTEE